MCPLETMIGGITPLMLLYILNSPASGRHIVATTPRKVNTRKVLAVILLMFATALAVYLLVTTAEVMYSLRVN